MTNSPTNAASAEVTVVDSHARGPLLLLIGSGLGWLVLSGVFALIASIQLHAPAFMADCAWFTHGRVQAMRESAFIYGWAGNAGLAIGLWLLGRLGGNPLRGLNWAVFGAVFWNLGVTVGLIGIATGDMTSYAFLQLPRYVHLLLAAAYAGIAISGVLAWSGRRTDGTFASQWYAVAALFLFPWMLTATEAVLFWAPVRGTVQAIAAGWYAQGVWSLWLAPLAVAGAYYVVPKVTGKPLPSYEFAPLGFWALVALGAWTGGRHLIGGPVPAWVPTMGVVTASMVFVHYVVLFLNLRGALTGGGTALGFIRFGLVVYLLVGVIDLLMSFRAVAVSLQFTFVTAAIEQLGLYGGISMMFFGAIYYLVPRLTGSPWASGGLIAGHKFLVSTGVLLLVIALFVAGWQQGGALLDPKQSMTAIATSLRTPLLGATVAQAVLILANLLLLVNFCRSACAGCKPVASAETTFRKPSAMEAHA